VHDAATRLRCSAARIPRPLSFLILLIEHHPPTLQLTLSCPPTTLPPSALLIPTPCPATTPTHPIHTYKHTHTPPPRSHTHALAPRRDDELSAAGGIPGHALAREYAWVREYQPHPRLDEKCEWALRFGGFGGGCGRCARRVCACVLAQRSVESPHAIRLPWHQPSPALVALLRHAHPAPPHMPSQSAPSKPAANAGALPHQLPLCHPAPPQPTLSPAPCPPTPSPAATTFLFRFAGDGTVQFHDLNTRLELRKRKRGAAGGDEDDTEQPFVQPEMVGFLCFPWARSVIGEGGEVGGWAPVPSPAAALFGMAATKGLEGARGAAERRSLPWACPGPAPLALPPGMRPCQPHPGQQPAWAMAAAL
jgi:hypothetical protein